MMKRFALLLSTVLVQACTHAPTSKYTIVSAPGLAAMHGAPTEFKGIVTPAFLRSTNSDQATMTVGMMFGAIGGGVGAAIAMAHEKSQGAEITAQDALADPTKQLTESLETALLAAQAVTSGTAHYEVHVETTAWGLAKSDVFYSATLKVFDVSVQPRQLLAYGECHFNNKDDKPKSSDDLLLDNHGEKLKQVLTGAVNGCEHEFEAKVFTMTAART